MNLLNDCILDKFYVSLRFIQLLCWLPFVTSHYIIIPLVCHLDIILCKSRSWINKVLQTNKQTNNKKGGFVGVNLGCWFMVWKKTVWIWLYIFVIHQNMENWVCIIVVEPNFSTQVGPQLICQSLAFCSGRYILSRSCPRFDQPRAKFPYSEWYRSVKKLRSNLYDIWWCP